MSGAWKVNGSVKVAFKPCPIADSIIVEYEFPEKAARDNFVRNPTGYFKEAHIREI